MQQSLRHSHRRVQQQGPVLPYVPLPPPWTTRDKHPTELDSQAADSVPEQKLLPFHTPTPTATL